MIRPVHAASYERQSEFALTEGNLVDAAGEHGHAAPSSHVLHRPIDGVLRHVDIVKVSVDDLELLRPNAGSLEAARDLLALGPGAVLVTDGPAAVAVHTASSQGTVEVPPVDVVDTIGADSFVAGFLTW